MMRLPSQLAAFPIGEAIRQAARIPMLSVTNGVARRSILVSLLIALPASEAMIATAYTAKGPPAPPRAFVAKPTGARVSRTIIGALSAAPMPTAIAGPAITCASDPIE